MKNLAYVLFAITMIGYVTLQLIGAARLYERRVIAEMEVSK